MTYDHTDHRDVEDSYKEHGSDKSSSEAFIVFNFSRDLT
jgi:hypothetical protein